MAVIPNSNVNLATNIRDVLNAHGSSCTNDVISFFDSRAVINQWSFRKPYSSDDDMFKLSDSQIRNINCGFDINGAQMGSYTQLPTKMDGNMNGWVYTRPSGGQYSPYRLGDYVGYDTDAKPMIRDFFVQDEASNTSPSIECTAMINQQDGKWVSLADIGGLSSYKPAVYMVNGDKSRMYKGSSTLSSGAFNVSIKGTELTLGSWTVYPFLIGGSTDSTYYTIPNVTSKTITIVSTVDDYTYHAEYVYSGSAITSVRFKFTFTNKSGGSTTNNFVALSTKKDDVVVDVSGEYQAKLPDFSSSGTSTYHFPKDYTGNDSIWSEYKGQEFAEIDVSKFNPSVIRFLVISIGSGRIKMNTAIMQQVAPK